MVIGIQTTNRLPLPGKGDSTSAPGRSPSDPSQGTASEQEPVEIQPSAPAANQPAIVQLNFSGASAFSKARLAGDRTTSDPNVSQSTPAPSVQSGDPSAAEAGGLRSSSWIPRALAGEAGLFGMNQSLSAALLDTSFIRATADLAASLLTGAGLPPARVVPLAGGSEIKRIR